ncbi:UNVERIFIED_CONTAM: hypothetical protein K2H54_009484 [Gekko kuhli]
MLCVCGGMSPFPIFWPCFHYKLVQCECVSPRAVPDFASGGVKKPVLCLHRPEIVFCVCVFKFWEEGAAASSVRNVGFPCPLFPVPKGREPEDFPGLFVHKKGHFKVCHETYRKSAEICQERPPLVGQANLHEVTLYNTTGCLLSESSSLCQSLIKGARM